MANKILVFLEQRESSLKKVSFEAASLAQILSKKNNTALEAVVIGNEISNLEEIKKYGLSKVVHFKNKDLENYSSSAYSKLVAEYVNEAGADCIIFGNTALGKDLAPFVAVKVNGACSMDCTKLDFADGNYVATRPVFAGKALVDVKLSSPAKVFTIRPNIFKASEVENSNTQIEVRDVNDPDLRSRVVSFKKSAGKLDVAEADIIVSGGRGLKGPENFHLIENLADTLGAAVGASRAVVDAGWRPHGEQVGQTGKTVSPSLYVACGISGAIQHLAGMSSSKYIVAINKDKDAPIFNVSDYGIVGDVFEILPALTEEVKKIKS